MLFRSARRLGGLARAIAGLGGFFCSHDARGTAGDGRDDLAAAPRAAAGGGLPPVSSKSLAGISRPYRALLSSPEGRSTAPLSEMPANSPLLKLPNVVLTPHLGGGSYRSWEMDMPASLANIQNYFAGT